MLKGSDDMIKKHKIIVLLFILGGILLCILVFDQFNEDANIINKIGDEVTSITNRKSQKAKQNRNSIFTEKVKANITLINFYEEEVTTITEKKQITDIYNLLNSMTLKECTSKEIIQGGLSMDIHTDELAYDIALYEEKIFINGQWYRTDDDYYTLMQEKLKVLLEG